MPKTSKESRMRFDRLKPKTKHQTQTTSLLAPNLNTFKDKILTGNSFMVNK